MAININPGVTRVEIPYCGESIVLMLRDYTTEEYCQFLKNRFKFVSPGNVDDHSSQARIEFIETILLDIKIKTKEGEEEVFFTDPATGDEKPLTPSVPNWKKYVQASFKCAAAMVFEGMSASLEQATLKN
ncbi:MAG: hypothetical protein H8E42_09305 [Nitrospinae bacterium]|nr:hypothetical protein [Nitrospinota bacterium]MBL7020693.1 hypothetical protein [Nitrospinaceae bacterium]